MSAQLWITAFAVSTLFGVGRYEVLGHNLMEGASAWREYSFLKVVPVGMAAKGGENNI